MVPPIFFLENNSRNSAAESHFKIFQRDESVLMTHNYQMTHFLISHRRSEVSEAFDEIIRKTIKSSSSNKSNQPKVTANCET